MFYWVLLALLIGPSISLARLDVFFSSMDHLWGNHHGDSFKFFAVHLLCNIVHEFRSSNVEAHNLAKHALILGSDRHVWFGQPEGIPFIHVNIVTCDG